VLNAQDMSEKQTLAPSDTALLPSSVADQTVEALRSILVGHTIADVERHLILDTLAYCLGNRTHAARILGISIRTLRNKLNEYMAAGIPVPEPGQKPPLAA
jgi:DNA-binding NtrC family response regulator